MLEFEKPIIIGVLFDLSIAHAPNGRRYIDIAKDHLIGLATKLGLSSRIYVVHPDNAELPRHQGESVYQIASYQEPARFDLEMLGKYLVYFLGSQDSDIDKVILVFTDRYTPAVRHKYQKLFVINELKNYDCKFKVFGIGPRYHKDDLAGLLAEYKSDLIQLEGNLDQLPSELNQLIEV